MTNKFKRIEWVDVAKAIAILMMVIGHEVQGNARVFIFFFSYAIVLYLIWIYSQTVNYLE